MENGRKRWGQREEESKREGRKKNGMKKKKRIEDRGTGKGGEEKYCRRKKVLRQLVVAPH